MKSLKIALAAAAIVAFPCAGAIAQDTTTSTTTVHEHQTEPGPGVNVGVPGVVGVHVGGPPVETGCTTKRRTTTDNETGDSATVSKSNC
ncbi:MAG TPA: hypothetical protein VHX43_01095 [Xanthobacteraceae bacterium]|jgi:hypothetical protein|nr:hypothetical protein [Xanthobacteraceae bacterium]